MLCNVYIKPKLGWDKRKGNGLYDGNHRGNT